GVDERRPSASAECERLYGVDSRSHFEQLIPDRPPTGSDPGRSRVRPLRGLDRRDCAGRNETHMAEVIGFIGLGVMGAPMAGHLVTAGFTVVVHNRSQGKVHDLVGQGATAAGSPADVAKQSTIVITMLPDTPDVVRVLTASDGVLSAIQKGALVIDMSSI